jgi:hypothetical protein
MADHARQTGPAVAASPRHLPDAPPPSTLA